jgi:hypothetical protein
LTKRLVAGKVDSTEILTVKKQALRIMSKYKDTLPDILEMLNELIEIRNTGDDEQAAKVSMLTYQRKGLIAEVAGAASYNTSRGNNLDRTGIWGNLSYYVSPDDLFTFTARFMHRRGDTALSNIDVGLSFLKKTPNFNISVEGLMRHYRLEIPDLNINGQPIIATSKKLTYRLAVQSSYMINDKISVNFNFGKDFNSPYIAAKGFFSILGLNYSIFNKPEPESTTPQE